jgi:hypothetical protein
LRKDASPDEGASRCLVAGEADTAGFHRFGKATADRAKDEGGNIPLRLKCKVCSFAREFEAAIELKACFAEELGGESGVGGPVNAPKPEFFLIALEESERLSKLFHGTIEGGGKEVDGQVPCVAGVLNANPDAVLAGLV